MNLFDTILNKAKSGANFIAQGKLGDMAFDWANQEQKDPIQRFFDDPNMRMEQKQGLMDNLKAGVPKEVLQSYITENYYKPVQFRETVPMARPLFPATGKENALVSSAKFVGNIPTSLYNIGAGGVNLASTAVQEGIGPTASMIGQGAIRMAGQGAESVSQAYQEGGAIGATERVLEGTKKAIVQDPALLFAPQMIKGAGQATMAGGRAIKRGAEAVAPKIKAIPKNIKKAPGAVDDLIESGVEKLANKALGSSDGSAELFKATSPSYNLLAKRKDIGKVKQQAKVADEAVVEAGFIPKTTTERVDAYKATMKKLWDDVQNARGGVQEKYKSSSISDTIRSEVDRMKVNGKIPPSLESDVSALLREADFYDSLGDVSLPDLGIIRSNINAKLTFGDKTQFSDAYNAVMQKVISTIREGEDAVLAKNAGQATSGMLAKYGALRNMLDDVVKQDIKASRAKGLPIEESFGRISGLAEMAGGVGQLIMSPKQAVPTMLSGGSKVLLGKVAGKMKDPDYLIRTGYEKLLKSKNSTNGNTPGNTAVVRPNSTRPTGKQKIAKPSPQVKPVEKTVKPKNLTEGKQSATMGDMETKKLIEEARKTPVYHGTNVEFKEFDPKRINTVESSGDYIGEGFYFTTSKESAKKYAQQAVKKKGGKEVIKEVTLDMKKPFIINNKSDIQKLNDIFGGEDNRIELLLDNPKAVREKLQSLGYDGLIDNLYGQRAVFNAKQIISK